ncbi:MAG: sugar transferase [Pirellulales bacterium]
MLSYRAHGKHIFDLTVAGTCLILSAPVLVVVALAVRCTIGAPILFRQKRAGLAGRSFWLIKFRTMNDERGPDGRLLPDAQRLTRIGRFLRASSLDELPELWNVLRGDMSMVGPRPLLTDYLPLYSAEQERRHMVKPGITGLAQVRGRNAISWEERLRLDVWYVDHISLILDLAIMLRTAMVVIRRRGISAATHVTMPRFCGAARNSPSSIPANQLEQTDAPHA